MVFSGSGRNVPRLIWKDISVDHSYREANARGDRTPRCIPGFPIVRLAGRALCWGRADLWSLTRYIQFQTVYHSFIQLWLQMKLCLFDSCSIGTRGLGYLPLCNPFIANVAALPLLNSYLGLGRCKSSLLSCSIFGDISGDIAKWASSDTCGPFPNLFPGAACQSFCWLRNIQSVLQLSNVKTFET